MTDRIVPAAGDDRVAVRRTDRRPGATRVALEQCRFLKVVEVGNDDDPHAVAVRGKQETGVRRDRREYDQSLSRFTGRVPANDPLPRRMLAYFLDRGLCPPGMTPDDAMARARAMGMLL